MDLKIFILCHYGNGQKLSQPDKLTIVASTHEEALSIAQKEHGKGYEVDSSEDITRGILDATWFD